jgi:hypothetical protein
MSWKKKHSKGSAMNEVAEVSSTTYMEMSNKVEAKLKRLAELASEKPKLKYTTLAYLLNEGFLSQCFRELGKNKAPGVDGATWEQSGGFSVSAENEELLAEACASGIHT